MAEAKAALWVVQRAVKKETVSVVLRAFCSDSSLVARSAKSRAERTGVHLAAQVVPQRAALSAVAKAGETGKALAVATVVCSAD